MRVGAMVIAMDEQIIGILREQDAGAEMAEVCRKHGISSATFYKCQYGGLDVSEAKRLRALEAENARLKRLLADAMLDNACSRRSSKKCMVRPVRARFLDSDDDSCVNVSGLSRVNCGCSQAMMRSARIVLR
jgi:transposase-like protein